MLSRFGQECLLRGYTVNSFEWVPEDDESDNYVLVIKDEDYLDPGHETECQGNPGIPQFLKTYNERLSLPSGQAGGYRRP